MNFTYHVDVQSSVEETWRKLQDTLAMVHCIPGVEEAEESAPGHFDVKIMTKLGPIALRFKGSADLVVDEADQVMEATVSMSDSRSGNVYGKFRMKLGPNAAGEGSVLQIDADVVIAGKLGELAQPLIKRKADQIVREFSQNLTNYLQAA
ncbi:hypothetical protein JI721_06625 [Alicyclobacillus cycloheptanicus]|uniref:Carbon monoxide dehydrogenase subunit G n=1 Tax=Alicyclobacillus cycloheptanicus TaxID=1457 RepID=A0ABT9XHR9_9BACL|nr:SRPBCC domain-containing protein [Alicyclobacillus cycloheptanicus]MDQ0189854.1 carbon monoxide dehydrogenase subunit G [Alicyclobacillus cycloheptanicus]WDM02462.1 hypothetical protein JI721_06625 [Alicyclobacillus cycloheptanicus]